MAADDLEQAALNDCRIQRTLAMNRDHFVVERRLVRAVFGTIEKLFLSWRERRCSSGRSPSGRRGGNGCGSPRVSQILIEASAFGLRERSCGWDGRSLTVYFGWVWQCLVNFWVLGCDLRVPKAIRRQKDPEGPTMKIALATRSWQESPTNRKSKFDTNYLLSSPKGLPSNRRQNCANLGANCPRSRKVAASPLGKRRNILP